MGPLLFIIYNNCLDSVAIRNVSKFANERKARKLFRTDQDANELHGDLDRLYEWAGKGLMEFNIEKCSVMSVERKKTLHYIPLS